MGAGEGAGGGTGKVVNKVASEAVGKAVGERVDGGPGGWGAGRGACDGARGGIGTMALGLVDPEWMRGCADQIRQALTVGCQIMLGTTIITHYSAAGLDRSVRVAGDGLQPSNRWILGV